jgi:hypothetical protein
MIRLDHRLLRDRYDPGSPQRLQGCAVDDARGVLIHWTMEGSWEPAGEVGFAYVARSLAFPFLVNTGGANASEGRQQDGRLFVFPYGLRKVPAARLSEEVVRHIAVDIEAALLLWPGLIAGEGPRTVYFWFPRWHSIFSKGNVEFPSHVDPAWFGERLWFS